MIDNKKIEEAALGYCAKCSDIANRNIDLDEDECVDLHNGFIDGAKWAINEFIKDLWHTANEKPKRRFNYLLLHYKDEEEECFEADVVDTKAWDLYIKGSLVEYINIDDLFVKKEYGHD